MNHWRTLPCRHVPLQSQTQPIGHTLGTGWQRLQHPLQPPTYQLGRADWPRQRQTGHVSVQAGSFLISLWPSFEGPRSGHALCADLRWTLTHIGWLTSLYVPGTCCSPYLKKPLHHWLAQLVSCHTTYYRNPHAIAGIFPRHGFHGFSELIQVHHVHKDCAALTMRPLHVP